MEMFQEGFEIEEQNYWISFSDLILGLMVIFMLISLSLMNKTDKTSDLKGKYTELSNVFEEEFKRHPNIEVADSSVIRFTLDENSKDLLFVAGESTPTGYFKEQLDDFIPIYYGKIKEVYRTKRDSFEIKEIRIEGHTDSKMDYMYNLELSSQRALSVLSYILQSKFFKSDLDFQNLIQERSISCGYSETKLLDKNGKYISESGMAEDPGKSRRVEFRLVLEYK